MKSLLQLKVVPILSMTQKEAAEALGGLEALRLLEERGLIPWDAKATLRRFRVSAIEEAMKRAEEEVRTRLATRPEKPAQSAAAE